MSDTELLTIPVGLMSLEGEYVKQYGQMMAGQDISFVLLLILLIYSINTLLKALASGAFKG